MSQCTFGVFFWKAVVSLPLKPTPLVYNRWFSEDELILLNAWHCAQHRVM